MGEITPTVRKPVGHLPSRRIVTVIGDAAILFDPIGAQGANTGNKMARHLAQAVAAHGDAAFDEAWIEQTFEAFYQTEGGSAYDYNNVLLEGIPAAGQEIFAAQYGSDGRIENLTAAQKIANDFCESFNDPRGWVAPLTKTNHARARISLYSGRSAMSTVVKGRGAII